MHACGVRRRLSAARYEWRWSSRAFITQAPNAPVAKLPSDVAQSAHRARGRGSRHDRNLFLGLVPIGQLGNRRIRGNGGRFARANLDAVLP